MPETLTDRAQDLLVRLYEKMAEPDPEGIYQEAAEAIKDLLEAWSAGREIIASLQRKLAPQ